MRLCFLNLIGQKSRKDKCIKVNYVLVQRQSRMLFIQVIHLCSITALIHW